MLPPHRQDSLRAFEDYLRQCAARGPLAVAFSGGLDSRFVTYMALQAQIPVLALHAKGPHMAHSESHAACQWAHEVGLTLHSFDFQPLALNGIRNNSPERCYICKQALIRGLHTALAALPGAQSWLLCDGTNADDLHAHRPGLRALREAGICSPLAECGVSKAQIRLWAHTTGLAHPDQQARPCLLTRLAYGMHPTAALLHRLAEAEAALAAAGLTDFRIRLRPAPLLQSRPLSAELRAQAQMLLHLHGFDGADMVEEEHIGGYFDRKGAKDTSSAQITR
ncbi:MAG: asparagine synthase-related protein [Desulfovibrionaceae bacterium]